MDTIKTDIKRAVCSLPFLISVAIMILVIIFGAGKDMLFPKEIKYGLFPFYHMAIIFRAFRSDIVLIIVPIICTLPYTAAFLDEYTSGYIKIYIMKTHKEDYVCGKVLASEEAVSPILNLIIKTTVFF